MELQGQAEITNAQANVAAAQAVGQGIANAGSAVYQAFQNGAQLEGQAEITNAQASMVLTQGLINAFPYAMQSAVTGATYGWAGGAVVGGVAGGVVGGLGGATLFGVGIPAGVTAGAIAGSNALGALGATGGGATGFFYGLATAPSWSDGSLDPLIKSFAPPEATAVPGSGDAAAAGGDATAATSPADTWAAFAQVAAPAQSSGFGDPATASAAPYQAAPLGTNWSLQQIASVPAATPPGQVVWPDPATATPTAQPPAPAANPPMQKTDNTTDDTTDDTPVVQTAGNDQQVQPPDDPASQPAVTYMASNDAPVSDNTGAFS